MGRKKRRCRTWQRRMKAKGRQLRDYNPRWDDISPGRLVAYADPEPEPQKKKTPEEKLSPSQKKLLSR